MQPVALKTPKKTMPNMAGWVDKIFQGRTKIFNTITENFYDKNFQADNFFLDSTKWFKGSTMMQVL